MSTASPAVERAYLHKRILQHRYVRTLSSTGMEAVVPKKDSMAERHIAFIYSSCARTSLIEFPTNQPTSVRMKRISGSRAASTMG